MSVGLIVGVRGIVGKELRSRTRGYWRPMLQLTVYLGLVTLAVVAVLGVSVSSSGTLSPTLGETLFAALATGSVLLIAFIAPALTTGTVSGERERRTLDLLLVTRASPLGLAAGKLAGALLWIAYLLCASLPALAVVNLFGGVPLLKAIAALSVTCATALGYTALGLALSAVVRRTVPATVLAYAAVLISVVIVPIFSASLSFSSGLVSVAAASGIGNGNFGLPPAPTWLTFLSPVNAIVSVLGGPVGLVQGGQGGDVSVLASYVARTPGPGPAPRLVVSLAPWLFFSLLSVLFAVACLLVSALALQPIPTWWRHRASVD